MKCLVYARFQICAERLWATVRVYSSDQKTILTRAVVILLNVFVWVFVGAQFVLFSLFNDNSAFSFVCMCGADSLYPSSIVLLPSYISIGFYLVTVLVGLLVHSKNTSVMKNFQVLKKFFGSLIYWFQNLNQKISGAVKNCKKWVK